MAENGSDAGGWLFSEVTKAYHPGEFVF